MSTTKISWGVNAAGAQGWQPYRLHMQIVMKSGSLNLLEPPGPVQASNGIALPSLKESVKTHYSCSGIYCWICFLYPHRFSSCCMGNFFPQFFPKEHKVNDLEYRLFFVRGCETWSLTLKQTTWGRYIDIGRINNSITVNTTPWSPSLFLCMYNRVRTLIVATIYLQLIQNRYMFRSFTVLQCSHQHCVQPVASDVEVVGYF